MGNATKPSFFSGFILTDIKSGKQEYATNIGDADSLFDRSWAKAGMNKTNIDKHKKNAFTELANNSSFIINDMFDLKPIFREDPAIQKRRHKEYLKSKLDDAKEAKAKAKAFAPPPDKKMFGGISFGFYSIGDTPGMLDADIRSLKRSGIKFRVIPFKGRYALYMFDPRGRY